MFTSWGFETTAEYEKDKLNNILAKLDDDAQFGKVLRAKGMVHASAGGWLHFDYVPGEFEVREGAAEVTGKICVIGSELKEDNLQNLFSA